MAANLISKAFSSMATELRKASRGSLSAYVPNAPHQYGQPRPEVAEVDVNGLITAQRMREVCMKGGTVAACMNAVLDYAANVPIAIRNVDPAQKADPEKVAFVEKIMRKPNRNDNGLEFKQKLIRDLFTMGMAGLEIEKGSRGHFANLNVLDAARLYIDYDEHGTILGYDMLNIYGMPISRGNDSPYAWAPPEVIFFRISPISESLYGTSRISQLFTYAIIEAMMFRYISERFTDSNVPHGVMDLGEITEEELRRAINQWNQQVDSPHKILLTGSKGKSSWYPFNYNLRDLEAPMLVEAVQAKIMSIVGVTKNELGDSQDVNKSNGYNLSYTFKKRAIEPLLNTICEQLTTRFLWEELGFDDLEFYYHEIDSRDELLQAQIDEVYMKMGVLTLNQIRNRRGDPSVPGGDDPLMFSGSAWIPIQYIDAFAQAQLLALMGVVQDEEAAGQGGGGGGGGGKVSPPLIRPPQLGMKMTTPDGSGSSTAKIKYPSAQPKSNTQQRPRGPTATLKHVGLRKD